MINLIFISLFSSASIWQAGSMQVELKTDCGNAIEEVQKKYSRQLNSVSCDQNGKIMIDIKMTPEKLQALVNDLAKRYPTAIGL